MITLQCLFEFQNKQNKEIVLDLMGRYLKQKIKEEKNEYKRNKIKSKLAKLRKNLKALQSHFSLLKCGKSKTATQQTVNQWKEQVSGLPTGKHKSWQALSITLAFCCLEKSYRDFSPLKRVIILKYWIAVANSLVPMLGIGTTSMPGFMTLPKYRLLGSEGSEMAE